MEISERQKLYLYYAFILRQPSKEVLRNTDLTQDEFKTWWADLKEKRNRIKPIRDIWIRKKCDVVIDYYDFEKQYLRINKSCHYCQITEAEIDRLWEIEYSKLSYLQKGDVEKNLNWSA